MKHAICRLLALCLCFGWLPVSAQDLTGIWQGNFLTSGGDQYKFELQVKQSAGNRLTGVSYSYLNTVFYGKAIINGHFNKLGKTALVQELKTVELRMSGNSSACIMKCSFRLIRSGNEDILEGTYTSTYEKGEPLFDIKRGDNCGGGKVYLRRVEQSDFYVEPFLRTRPVAKKPATTPAPRTTNPAARTPATTKTPQKKPTNTTKPNRPATPPPTRDTVRAVPPVIAEKPRPVPPRLQIPATTRSRVNELARLLTVENEEITVRLYDNGEIDDDTISVYMDGKLMLSGKRLSTTPLTIKLKMDENQPEHVLVMVAENLGRIPPNTSLMIVQDGDKRYEVRITSSEQKNAMVRFRYGGKGN